MNPYLNTYARVPLELVRGEGCRVLADDGRWYLDAFAGIAVLALGHGHPRVREALHRQVDRILHTSNVVLTDIQRAFAERLSQTYEGSRLFFTNSGVEAIECAVKLTRKHHFRRGDPRHEVLVLDHAFHGRTLMALALTPKPAYQEGYGPLPEGVRVCSMEELPLAVTPRTAAVLVEPVQGEGGCRPVTNLAALRAACDAHGALLIYDEIQCGLGRSGELLHQPRPDLRTLAKALGGGLPLGACLLSPQVEDPFRPGDHGSTFGGNPVSCAAGLATLEVILEEDLPARCARLGERLAQDLERLGVSHQGRGLLQAAHLGRPAGPVVDAMRARGVLVVAAGPQAVRFVPPFILSEAELDELVSAFAGALAETT